MRLIASDCTVLRDLGLPFPDITEAESGKPINVVHGLDDIAQIFKSRKILKYLLFVAPATDHPAMTDFGLGEKPFAEVAARNALNILTTEGLSLEYFSIAIRNKKWEFEPVYSSSTCHLRVHKLDPMTRSVVISEKKLGRNMEHFGDVEGLQFYNLVEKMTGQPHLLKDRSREFW